MTIAPDMYTMSDSDPLLSHETTLELRSDSGEWKLDGLCRQVDPDLWFPEGPSLCSEAKKVCRKCPVIDQCLEYALKYNEKHGVWGGKTASQRRRLRLQLGYTREYHN